MVLFAEFDRKYHTVLNIKSEEWDLKILLLNSSNDHVLGSGETNFLEVSAYLDSVETYFLEDGTYVSVKRAVTGV